ncbi:Rieske 2Fe-2S domain-containing protein [Patulibacter sp. NPDC049589]|uniref:Rieske 2Fe-2S domain-containing protein n=1 Tax=Patulibacter sp. NPDC049589 TaxID=3154731 RepID=UPI003419160C
MRDVTIARSPVAEAGTTSPADLEALRAGGFTDVGSSADVPMLEGRSATVDGRRVAVFRLPTGFAATDAACPHKGGPLSDGLVADGCVTCPLHNWRLDLTTGEVKGDDTVVPIHDVVVAGGRLWVRIAAGAGAAPAPAPRVTAGAIGAAIAASPTGDANPFVATRRPASSPSASAAGGPPRRPSSTAGTPTPRSASEDPSPRSSSTAAA